MAIFPPKLTFGSQVRVVSPARSLSMISADNIRLAVAQMAQMGLKVSFSEHASDVDEFISSSVENRVADLHDAFSDASVHAVFATIGGYNANQLLQYLDYDLIARNPKILCGYSDITALGCAVYAKTGLVTYSGPAFSTFGMEQGFGYIAAGVRACLFSDMPYRITPAEFWSNDQWYADQLNRKFMPNEGYWILQPGHAGGTCIGGNLCTLNLLQGTEFMPPLENSILFLEDDHLSNPFIFDRDLQSLLHLPDAQGIKALIIGRFEQASGMRRPLLEQIIASKKELKNIPVIANADFGHTMPLFTFPVGGVARVSATTNEVMLEIEKH